MGVITYDTEVVTTIPPTKMFKAFVLEADTFITKIMPQAIKSVVTLEGDGGPGTIKQINFGEGTEFKYMKERTDAIDKEKFTYASTVIDGDILKNKIEKIYNEMKFEASPDGGTMCKRSSIYYTKGASEIKEEEIKAGQEKAMAIFKAIEAYLLANPDA